MSGIARFVRLMALAPCAVASIAQAQADSVIGHHGPQFAIGGAAAMPVGSCGGCAASGLTIHDFSLMLRMGAAITPHLVVSPEFDVWDTYRTRNDESATWELLVLQYYPNARNGLYVSAGAGVAQLQGGGPSSGIDPGFSSRLPSPNVVGLEVGAGYDLHVAGSFFLTPAIDVLYALPPRTGDPFWRQSRPAVIRAGLSIGRQPGGEIARASAASGDGLHGLQISFAVTEGVKPAACASCTGVGGPNAGGALILRAGWAVSPNVVLSAGGEIWKRSELKTSESVTWQMLTAQYFPNPRKGFYLDAGAGWAIDAVQSVGSVAVDVTNSTAHTPGLMAGVGYESSTRSSFSVAPSLDVLYAMPQRNAAGTGSARVGTALICAGMTLVWR